MIQSRVLGCLLLVLLGAPRGTALEPRALAHLAQEPAGQPAPAPVPPKKKRTVDLTNDFVSLRPVSRQDVAGLDVARLARAAPGAWSDFDPASIARDRELAGYYQAAERMIRAGDWIGALGCLLRVLKGHPDHPPALHMAGMVYFRLQRYGDAALLLGRYVEVAPARVGDTRVLGHALYSLGRYEEARAHYGRVLEAAPADVEARNGLALALWRLGDEDGALKELDLVLERAPEHDEALAWKAQVLFERGDSARARAAVRRAVELDPSQSRAWFLLARIANEAGDESEAATAQAAFTRTTAARQAVIAAERHYAANPYSPAAFDDLLRLRLELGDRTALKQSLTQAQAFPYGNERVWRRVLDIAVRVGRTQEAAFAAQALAGVAGDSVENWSALLAYSRAAGDRFGEDRAAARLATLQGR